MNQIIVVIFHPLINYALSHV